MPRQELFGQIAIRLGFVSDAQVQSALGEQSKSKTNGRPHKLIGMLLLDAGALTSTQLIDVLREMERQRSGEPAAQRSN